MIDYKLIIKAFSDIEIICCQDNYKNNDEDVNKFVKLKNSAEKTIKNMYNLNHLISIMMYMFSKCPANKSRLDIYSMKMFWYSFKFTNL